MPDEENSNCFFNSNKYKKCHKLSCLGSGGIVNTHKVQVINSIKKFSISSSSRVVITRPTLCIQTSDEGNHQRRLEHSLI